MQTFMLTSPQRRPPLKFDAALFNCGYGQYVHPSDIIIALRGAADERVRISLEGLKYVQAENPTHHDVELVTAMARGDEAAASALYDRHAAIVYGLALRIVGEPADAEEVVIDGFSQAWRDADRYDKSRGSVAGWLTTIVRTRALDLVRARGRRSRITDNAADQFETPIGMGQGFAPTDRLAVENERADAVASAMDELPIAQRTAIELAFFEGLTHLEVAERLHEPLGTIKTRIRLGMHKLREMLVRLSPGSVS